MKRNELKKMIVTVGMAAVMAGALSGCGKEEKKDSTTQATTTQAATQNDTTQVEGQGDVVDGYATVSPEEFEEETGRSAFEGRWLRRAGMLRHCGHVLQTGEGRPGGTAWP